jgi:hypothetical protein
VLFDVADRVVFRPEIRGEEEASLMAVKTEGGKAVTSNPLLAERMRLMPLYGLSRDARNRYGGIGSLDYQCRAGPRV